MQKWLLRIGIVAAVVGAGFLAWQFLKPEGLPEGFAASNGRIEATEINVAAKIAGRVETIVAREGDFVATGEVLAKMDTAVPAEAQLQEAIVNVETARVRITQREAEKAAALALVGQREAELNASKPPRALGETCPRGRCPHAEAR